MGLNNARNGLFIPQMGLLPGGSLYSPNAAHEAYFASWHLQNGRAFIVFAPRKLQSIIYNFKASFKTFHLAGMRPPSAYAVANWENGDLLRNPLQRWKAKRSLTQLASNDTPKNSGWENYLWDDPTQNFAALADRTRREFFRQNTLELCRQR